MYSNLDSIRTNSQLRKRKNLHKENQQKKRGLQRVQILKTLLENPDGKLSKSELAKLSNCKYPLTFWVLKNLEENFIMEKME